jgi:hypothetical protein
MVASLSQDIKKRKFQETKNAAVFAFPFKTCHFLTAVNSKRMIGNGPGWLHSLCLIELFPDFINFLKIYSVGLAQQQNYM